MMVRTLAALAAFLGAVPVHAVDLLDIYHQAQMNDARHAAARAQFRAIQERVPQAKAGLRPDPRFCATSACRDVGGLYRSPGMNSVRSNCNGHDAGSHAIRPM